MKRCFLVLKNVRNGAPSHGAPRRSEGENEVAAPDLGDAFKDSHRRTGQTDGVRNTGFHSRGRECPWWISHLDDHDSIQGSISLPVASPVEAMSVRFPARGWNRTGAAEFGESGVGTDAFGIVTDEDEHLSCGTRGEGRGIAPVAWSAPLRSDSASKAGPSRFLPTATPPSWAGLPITRSPGRRGSIPAAMVSGPSRASWPAPARLEDPDKAGPVALSADGNTAIVGGPFDTSNSGAAWVFNRSGGVWTQQGNKLVGSGAVGRARQGATVALSADGNTAIVGGPFDNWNTGAAWVFTRSNGVWIQQRSKLVGAGAVGNAGQGSSVALSSHGNTAIVGGPLDNLNTGAAWVFTRSDGVWTQPGNKLVGTDAIGSARQGSSVALSVDGSTAIVGGPFDNLNTGAAWVYTCSGSCQGHQAGRHGRGRKRPTRCLRRAVRRWQHRHGGRR